ncbi:MAG: BolA family transcriptional regulator [Rhodanobacteraceae bacterium]|nr:MAG: BolA family transcriptional regulator [Rhodanobacteraceae bacterium]
MSAASIDDIRARLQRAFAPARLEVIDEGHLHIGHAGEGTGHFRVRIAGAAFAGKTRVQQHRLVYDALADLMGHGIHALAIEAQSVGPQMNANKRK